MTQKRKLAYAFENDEDKALYELCASEVETLPVDDEWDVVPGVVNRYDLYKLYLLITARNEGCSIEEIADNPKHMHILKEMKEGKSIYKELRKAYLLSVNGTGTSNTPAPKSTPKKQKK